MLSWIFMLCLAHAGELTAYNAEPITTRAGHPRFVTPELGGTGAEADALARLASEQDAVEVRMALVEWLPRLGGDWAEGLHTQLAIEPDAKVRRVIADVAAKAPAAAGAAILRQAATDEAPEVRQAAMRAALAVDAELNDVITRGLDDMAAGVRAESARTASHLGLPVFTELAAMLDDADAEVRLQALKGVERLDAHRAASLALLSTLAQDRDPRVARTAQRLIE